jgi:hypothetical protein
MPGPLRSRLPVLLASSGAIGAAAAFALAAPSVSLASEVEYTTTFEPQCLIVGSGTGGSGDTRAQLGVTIKAEGPSEAFASEGSHTGALTLRGASVTVTAPASVSALLEKSGATEAAGRLTNLTLQATQANPTLNNIGKPVEYPEGVPFVSSIVASGNTVIRIPSKKLGETTLTYKAGSWGVNEHATLVKLLVSNEPGFQETESEVFKLTGKGLLMSVEGRKEGKRLNGPVTVACNPPSDVVLAEVPIKAEPPGLEGGHPEIYTDRLRLLETSHNGLVGWGTLQFASAALETEVSCVNFGIGSAWNEGKPAVGRGEILSWHASGNTNILGGEPSRECAFKRAGSETAEAWVTDEPAIFEVGRSGPQSVPWELQLLCVENEGVKVGLAEIGIPKGTPLSTGCKTSAEEAAAVEKEEEERTGCYANTVPEGCIKVNLVVPSLGIEAVFEGTQRPKVVDGFVNGLHPSRWSFSGPTLGKLHLRGVYADVMAASGEVKVSGFNALQLITVK